MTSRLENSTIDLRLAKDRVFFIDEEAQDLVESPPQKIQGPTGLWKNMAKMHVPCWARGHKYPAVILIAIKEIGQPFQVYRRGEESGRGFLGSRFEVQLPSVASYSKTIVPL